MSLTSHRAHVSRWGLVLAVSVLAVLAVVWSSARLPVTASSPANFSPQGEDAGPAGLYTLGDFVWYDSNQNGQFDTGETGIDNVLVFLYRDDGDGVYEPGTGDPLLDQMFTGNNPATPEIEHGWYDFNIDVTDVLYWVAIAPSNFSPGAPLEGHVLTSESTIGPNPLLVPMLSSVPDYNDADFGYVVTGLPAAIGDYVWYDADGDGLQDVTEPGIGNVALNLYQDDGDGVFNAATDTLVDTLVTDQDGGYLFTDLVPGTYFVDVDATNPALAGLVLTTGPQSSTDPTGPITVAGGDTYRDADFGYQQPTGPGTAVIGDTVWYDYDADGVQDPGEPGIPGVTVTVTDSNGATYPAVTDVNGNYQVVVPADGVLTYTAQPTAGLPAGLTPTTPVPAVIPPLQPGDQYLDADFGYDSPDPATIGGTLWEDEDQDGLLDPGEPRLAGVSVSLLDPAGNVVATTTTDTNGNYTFDVPPGTYQVVVTDTQNRLDDYAVGPLGPNPGQDNNNQAQPYTVTVGSGESNTTADFGYVQENPDLGTIGNQIWVETDGDGLWEPQAGELGVEGVTVDLFRDGILYASTTTGASGDYVFTGLPADDYEVVVTDAFGILAGYNPTTLIGGTADNTNKDETGYAITLPAGGQNLTADFGYILPAAIGDYVWYDADGDGLQDVTEPGIGNVTLNLYQDDGDGVFDPASDTLVDTLVTDQDGGYLFTDLVPGTYFVDVDATNPALAGLVLTTGPQSSTDPSAAITVAGGDTFREADFGYRQPTGPGTAVIGDTVWYDYDADGVQDPGEPGIPGVTVTVTDSNGATYPAVTDVNGNYQVVVPADGVLTYTAQPTAGLPAGLTPTTPVPAAIPPLQPGAQYLDADFGYDSPDPATIGGTLWEDEDQDGLLDPTEPRLAGVSVSLLDPAGNVVATTTTDTNGNYTFDVPPGTYQVVVTDTQNRLDDYAVGPLGPNPGQDNNNQAQPYTVTVGSGESNTTADFGYVQENPDLGTIGNQIWVETDGDGLWEPQAGELGVEGVTVDLFRDGILYASTTTGASGDYVFTGLPAGDYEVVVTDAFGILAGYNPTTLIGGTADNTNKDETGYAITLPAGGQNLTADFGYILPAAIGDYVWYDADGDGLQDVTEPGIGNVALDLYLDDGDGVFDPASDTLVDTLVTDQDGGYLFTDLVPGTYFVDVAPTNPALTGLVLVTTSPQSNTDPAGPITVVGGDTFREADFGYRQPTGPGTAVIGDTVWYDYDADGVQDPGEPGIPGVTVTVTDSNGATYPVVTDVNGNYQVVVPADGVLTYTAQPTAGLPAGLTPTTPVPAVIPPLQPGAQYLDADFGYDSPAGATIGGTLWEDEDQDGLLDPTEPRLPGVSVSLLDPAGNVVATTTTDTNGNYTFDVPPGTYQVVVTDTQNRLDDYAVGPLGPNPGQDNNSQAQPYTVTVGAGASNTTADFGYVQENPDLGTIGNQIWVETDGDGLWEPQAGELGIEGVTVDLFRDGIFYASTTTGASGDYVFTSLPAGNYEVVVTDAFGILAGYNPTTLIGGTADNTNKDETGYAITLPAGGQNLTADFGYILPAAIGDYVWYDADGDGLQDVTEPGIGNVALDLYLDDGDGVFDPASDTLVDTLVTDQDGGYLFTDLVPGTYFVDVAPTNPALTGLVLTSGPQAATDPAGPITVAGGDTFREADFGYRQPTGPGTAVIGDTVWYDYDADGVQDPGEPGIPGVTVTVTDSNGATYPAVTDVNGNYQVVVPADGVLTYTAQPTAGLPAGLTPTTPVPAVIPPLQPGDQYLDADFGYDSPDPATIGGTLWEDEDQDGLLDPGEPRLAGVSVSLLDPATGAVVATTTTDTNGNYTFDVPPGTYQVVVTDTQNRLDDYAVGPLGPNPGQDNNNQAQPYTVTVGSGESNTTADFGYVQENPDLGTIGNQIWVETDGDGLWEPQAGELGVEGVTVDLFRDGILYASTTTGASGDYVFTGLPAGNYEVVVTDAFGILAGYNPTTLIGGTADNTNKDETGYAITLPAGGQNLTADFGYILPAAGIRVEKTPDLQQVVSGDTATFTIVVTNIGETPLTNVTVSDPQAPDCARTFPSLASGASQTYTCVLANVTNDFTNVATVTGTTPTGGTVTDDDDAVVDVIGPSILISKTPDLQQVASGGTATFNITVTNTGDVLLTDVTVSDSQAPGCARTIGTLAPTASFAYTCAVTNVTAEFTNVAIATGTTPTGGTVTDDDDAVVDIPSSIQVIKTASPTTVPEPGGTVVFTVRINNTSAVDSITIDSLVDSVHGDLNGQGTCTVPQTIAAGSFYQCTFSATVNGVPGYTETDRVTATGTDDDGNPVTGDDDATVTVTDLPSSIRVLKTASPTTLPEPGGTVVFTVRVDNTSQVDSVTITSLADSIHGDLNGQGTCSVPQAIAAGSFYQCTFSAAVTGNAGDSETDVVTATGTDDDGNPVTDDDDATVIVTDLPSSIRVLKTASPTTLPEPGGTVVFTVRIDNTSQVDSVTINSLVDSVHGNLNGQGTCTVPQAIAAGSFYQCTFSAAVTGNAGDSETDVVTATGTDDDGNPVTGSDDATVTLTDVLSSAELIKTANPNILLAPGGTVVFTVRVNNTSTVDSITINSLVDSIHGNLNGQGTCTVPQTIPAGSFYQCTFSATVTGNAGYVETDVITVTGVDDDGRQFTLSDDATVTIVAQPVTNTPTPTQTNTPTNTPTPTRTSTPTNTPTNTPTSTPTRTPTNTPTNTPTPTPTRTPTRTPTNTPTPGECYCAPDIYEVDDTQGQAKPLLLNSTPQAHTFHVPSDVDWLRIDGLTANRSYNVATSNLVASADTYMILYDQGGNIVKTNDDIDTARCLTDPQFCASTITWTAANSGPYYLIVRTLTFPPWEYPSCPCPGYDIQLKSLTYYLPIIVGPPSEPPTPTPTHTPTIAPTPTITPTPGVPTEVPAGMHPKGIAVNPETHLVYVTSRDDDRLYLIDGLTNTVIKSVKVGDEPWGVAVNRNTNKVYVANFASGNLFVLDGATLAILNTLWIGPNPTFVEINENTNMVFVVTYGNDGLVVIDGNTDEAVTITGAGGKGAWGLAVNPNLNRVYVSNRDSGNIATLDGTDNWKLIASQSIKTGGANPCSPYELAFNPVNNKLYAACGRGNVDTALIYNASASGLVPLARVPIGSGGSDGGGGVTVNTATGNAFFTNSTDDTVSVISGTTNAVIATVPVGDNPFGIGVDPVTGRVFAGNRDSQNVSVFQDPSAP